MSTQRFTLEFKEETVRQIVDRGYGVPAVAARLGVSAHGLYKWVKAVSPDKSEQQSKELLETKGKVLRLREQMRRMEEERYLLKKRRGATDPRAIPLYDRASAVLCYRADVLGASCRTSQFLCLAARVCLRSGKRRCAIAHSNPCIIPGQPRVYGARGWLAILREASECCGLHRIERIMRKHKIKAIRGYKSPRVKG